MAAVVATVAAQPGRARAPAAPALGRRGRRAQRHRARPRARRRHPRAPPRPDPGRGPHHSRGGDLAQPSPLRNRPLFSPRLGAELPAPQHAKNHFHRYVHCHKGWLDLICMKDETTRSPHDQLSGFPGSYCLTYLKNKNSIKIIVSNSCLISKQKTNKDSCPILARNLPLSSVSRES